ncbi:MAG: protein-export rane protein SecD [Verrucomicrobia bacterium]|nr:protein-export rane protein SecD [Verrucomicrobiota bacterium]
MFRRNLWKIALSLIIVAWAVSTLLPLRDRDFATYAKAHATAKSAEFAKLADEAVSLRKAGHAPSDYVALKQIAKDRKLDLTQYFTDIELESKLTNVEKRNSILLTELSARSKAKLQRGLDLAGGVAFTLEVDPKAAEKFSNDTRKEKLTKAIEIIGNRINSYGIAEPVIRPVGENRIEVQLAGVNPKDNPDILDLVKKPARLDFRTVHPTLTPATAPNGEVPPGYEILTLEQDGPKGESYSEDLFVKRIPEMGGDAISDSGVRADLYGKPEVTLNFTKEGRKHFADITREIANNGRQAGRAGRLAIVLDGRLYSAPTVKDEIDSQSAQISGGAMTDREAFALSNVLNNPLDLPLTVKEVKIVGPSLAEDAVSSGVRASIIGTVLVAAFMITFYTTGGLVAVVTLAVNVVIIFGVMASLGATMTLPGLAGIVLTIGMAVDANILIFERMREELALGKSLQVANQTGYMKALMTILDAHAVQLIICAIMIIFGQGPIKGFGVTLAIGVLSTLFSVLITAHLVMEMLIESNFLKRFTMRRMLKDLHIDFVKYGKPAFIGGWLIVALGVGVVLYKGDRIYGIDFAGGEVISIEFNQRLDIAKVRQVAENAKLGEVQPRHVSALGGGKEVLEIETREGKSDALFAALKQNFPNAGLEKVGESHIGASIGKEIEWNALRAVTFSMLTILIYIAFRFEFGFGIGAMVSSLHDILMTIGLFVLFDHQFSAPMVAAILCIAGYSINETVVVFDRIREELKLNPTGSLRDIINSAINKVFARTIMTATTTFLAALSLFLFGGGVLRDISFTFLVGIVTSTFSAIFVAAQVFYWWHKGDRKHVEAHSDVAPKYEWTGSSKASQ